MTTLHLDIETIPDQREGAKERFIKESVDDFKAPSGLTKTIAAKDLGLDAAEAKFISKDDMIIKWQDHFAPIKAEAVGIENWRNTGFDGAQGELFSVAWATNDGEILGAYRNLDDDGGEVKLLQYVFDVIQTQCKSQPFFVGNYIAGFDLKFLFKRAVMLQVKPPFELNFAGRHNQHF